MRKFTDDQVKYVKRWFKTCDSHLIAKEAGMTVVQVRNLAKTLNLTKSVNKKRGTPPRFFGLINLPNLKKIHAGQIKAIKVEPLPAPECYEQYEAIADKHDAKAPRKNWFQRLVSWLLTGRA